MISKNPNNEIAANRVYSRGFDQCEFFSENESFWDETQSCDDNFLPDSLGKITQPTLMFMLFLGNLQAYK